MPKELVRLSKEFKTGLDTIGKKGQTYEDLLKQFLPKKYIKIWWKKGGSRK